MGKAQSKNESKNDERDDAELQRARRLIEEKSVTGAQDLMRDKLDRWRDVKVKIGITGDSGAGKSSFINAFRGIDDEDEGAAKTDCIETTFKTAEYPYPENPNIILVDLPTTGTPKFPDLDTYCDEVRLETYDTFLILTATRFRKNDLELARKVKSMEKSFFLVRTKIDNDASNEERKKNSNIEAMSERIRAACYENMKYLEIREDEIFLISNFYKDKWDFNRLVQAILDKLPTLQQEALTLPLRSLSKNVSRRKVKVSQEKSQLKNDECYDEELQRAKRLIEEKGVTAAQDLMREKLDGWRDIKVKIGVTGNSGVGKSSFINALRGIGDEDEGAAKIGCVETTSEPAYYRYPDNPNIILVDLPGIGTPNFPDLATYCDKVRLETYDTFLILTAERFRQNDLKLARKVKSMEKSFFLVWTKIDNDESNEKRMKNPDIEAMSRRIRANCHENTKGFKIREDEIFLVSNHDKNQWDFNLLVQAILDKLPTHQQEAFTLSLKILSKDILRRKVEVLRNQLWWISKLSLLTLPIDLVGDTIFRCVGLFKAVCQGRDFPEGSISQEDSGVSEDDSTEYGQSDQFQDVVAPVGLASISIALALLGKKTKFYRSVLGLPEEDSEEFERMKPEFKERMRKLYPKKEDKGLWERVFEILTKPLHLFSVRAAPFDVLQSSLNQLLNEMLQLSLELLDDAAIKMKDEKGHAQ